MRNNIFLAALLSLAVIAGCKQGGDGIVGTWKFNRMTINGKSMKDNAMEKAKARMEGDTAMADSLKQIMMAQVETQATEMDQMMSNFIVTFNEDGTTTSKGGETPDTSKYTLSEDGKKLTITGADGRKTEQDVKIEGNNLTLSMADGEDRMEMVFTRNETSN